VIESLAQSLVGERFCFSLFCVGVTFVEVFAGESRFLVALSLAARPLIIWLPLSGNGFQVVVGHVVDVWDC
jgi:hypothetical protein